MNRRLFALMLVLTVAGCANVSPTQRGTLARPDMQLDADIGLVKIREQTYASKEGAAGGRGTGGGGCGCT
ncbi:MAG: DUF4266 domain-containing protein [Betaproteobacteria bacterium]|nr:DUF4266 domain-containing protein [Betaproteobacteria bacterium]